MNVEYILFVIKSIVEHEGFIAAYGVIGWNAIHFGIDKKKDPTLTFKQWRKKHATDIQIMIVVALGMVIFDDELVDMYNDFVEDDITIQRWMYFLPGFLTGRILKWVYKEEIINNIPVQQEINNNGQNEEVVEMP